MCGIFGCVLKDGSAASVIHAALKRLEYRGYDSVGEATLHDNKLYIKKDQGNLCRNCNVRWHKRSINS